jgi:hypothetical protein
MNRFKLIHLSMLAFAALTMLSLPVHADQMQTATDDNPEAIPATVASAQTAPPALPRSDDECRQILRDFAQRHYDAHLNAEDEDANYPFSGTAKRRAEYRHGLIEDLNDADNNPKPCDEVKQMGR